MRRKIVSLIAALLVLTVLGGCAKPADAEPVNGTIGAAETVGNLDAAGVYEKMQQAVDGKPASAFTNTTEMGAKINAAVISLEADMSAVTDVKLSADPFRLYSATSLRASFFGVEIAESFRIYSATDETGLDCYFHIDSADSWYHHQTAMVPTDLLGQYAVTGCSAQWVPQNLTMEEQTRVLDGQDVYVLSCSFSAADVLSAISSPFGEISLENVDITGLQLLVTYYVNAESFLPVQIEIEYRGIGEVMGDLISKYAGQMMGGSAVAVEADVNSYRDTLSGLVYGAVEVPEVPEEGIRSSRDVAEFDIMSAMNFFG